MSDDLQARLDALIPLIAEGSPHAKALGFVMEKLGPAHCRMRAPADARFIGDPDTGVVAGGLVTALLDHASGMAAFAGMGAQASPATLDLRIDYLRPAKPGADIVAMADCFKVTRSVAFVRACAHDGDPEDAVATAQAAFMTPKAAYEAAEKARADLKAQGHDV
ncbi:MAG: PaaI family thioesterase [Maricaulaceae bacterium]